METYKKFYTVEYWACRIEKHHHRTKEMAEKCISKHGRSNDWGWNYPKSEEREQRKKDIAASRSKGITYRAIAAKHGISISRVREIYRREST